jgi:pyridoxine/pyridoxamine 5'-phosphate oxidase
MYNRGIDSKRLVLTKVNMQGEMNVRIPLLKGVERQSITTYTK